MEEAGNSELARPAESAVRPPISPHDQIPHIVFYLFGADLLSRNANEPNCGRFLAFVR
jgi:hypothetical protein